MTMMFWPCFFVIPNLVRDLFEQILKLTLNSFQGKVWNNFP